jgi:hypothetical protein
VSGLDRALSRLLISGLAALASCGKSPEVHAPMPPGVVAQIGERNITIAALTNALWQRQSGSDREQSSALLDNLIRSEILLARVRTNGYGRRPEVLGRFESFPEAVRVGILFALLHELFSPADSTRKTPPQMPGG